jgi:sugar lactone lactonase YvrE
MDMNRRKKYNHEPHENHTKQCGALFSRSCRSCGWWLILLALAIAVFSLAGCDWIEDLYHPGARDKDDESTGGTPTPEYMVSTLAGDGDESYADGTGTAARFNRPWGVAADGKGNLYVADSGNNCIRKIVIATGAVTTLAGDGTVGYRDGTGTVAQFNNPWGIAVVGGNLYVADSGNYRIRKIVIASGAVSTFAGPAGSTITADYVDGTGAAARFGFPIDIAADGNGNLYVVDGYLIRKIVIATQVVTTLAGSTEGSDAGPGTGTQGVEISLQGIAADGGNLYVTEYYKIRKIVIATGEVTTLAGGTGGYADGTGAAAQFNNLFGIAADGGNLYVADTDSHRIRKIVIATGEVTTYAGSGVEKDEWGNMIGGYADGPASAAQFHYPHGIAVDGSGKIYVADTGGHRIRVITPP